MPIQQTSDRLILSHPKGATAEILLYGATVISWKSASTTNAEILERLFVSSQAIIDGSKAVRGGIPIVFPCFGAPALPEHSKLNQHGFARSEYWSWEGTVMDNEAGVSVRLSLTPTPALAAKYNKPFHLEYVVTLAEHQLSTDLHVKNTSTSTQWPPEPLRFNALFHTYIRAPANKVLVGPLKTLSYFDKTQPTEEEKAEVREERRQGVDVLKFTDSVYQNTPKVVEVVWPGGGIEVRSTALKDTVIWNPRAEAGNKLSDMEDGGWERFVCVEPGVVRQFADVEPGMTWVGQQVLSVISNPDERYLAYQE